MDHTDTPKARRPLPTPGAAQAPRPSTPIQGSAQRPIEAASFYGTKSASSAKAPPPLPSRPKAGSSNVTAYVPPPEPPRYGSNPPGYREPELVPEETAEEELPALISQEDSNNGWSDGWKEKANWNADWVPDPPRTSNFDPMDYLGSAPRHDIGVRIDGRVDFEEQNWWKVEERKKWGRPGPGMLPPVVADELHDPHHSLFSVNVPSMPPPPSANPPSTARPDQSGSFPSSSQAPHSAHPLSSTPSLDPSYSSSYPSEEEVRTAVPHPNSYYCPKENGWVILSWKSSNVPPPFAASFSPSQHPLPDMGRRRRTNNCLNEEEGVWGKNKTHHFHRYAKAVDSLKLPHPYKPDSWSSDDALKQKRRGRTIVNDVGKLRADQAEDSGNESSSEPEGKLLDLYICCQCGFYCVASNVIPGIIPRKYLDELVRDKQSNPLPGKSGEITVVIAIDTFLVAIENKLFKGNNRLIKIGSKSFQAKLGWNAPIKKIFDSMGFGENTSNNDSTLMAPLTDTSSPESIVRRKRLFRAWVELSAWLLDYKRVHSAALRDYNHGQKIYVQIDNAREMYQRAIGAHPDQIPRGELQDPALSAVRGMQEEWTGLGLTPTTFSPELVAFAYLSQVRCDPAGTAMYFTYLTKLVTALQAAGSCPPQLQELLVIEQSRERFTFSDVQAAARDLGFGVDGDLRVEYDDEIEVEFVEGAWRDLVKRSWKDLENGGKIQRSANEALKILAQVRNSDRLMKVWEAGHNKMNPEQAYNTLEVPKETDDAMLITVFSMRLEETTIQMESMREAMSVIAEVRDSERLRQFLATGQDPGEIVIPTRPDFPRGLNQLGNTCYLNSLLQYFYTIKDLRDAVRPMSHLDLKSIEEDKLSDEDINKHRVGGRRVTRREIIRSKKFINQLADLFFNLEFSDTPAITPSIELAKLALVTSRDEEEDEVDKGGSDSSNDTDATLVDDGTSTIPASEPTPSQSKSSVLGKRARDVERQKSIMDVDDEGYVLVSSPRNRDSPEPMDQDRQSQLKDKDGDVAMRQGTPVPEKPPPPPPKKRAETIDSGGMMFGKQHDVAECMDNCMFQIETALLKFDAMIEGQSGKGSVVKQLFYGRIRQRLTGVVPNSRSSIHEKEDLFSHLPVNVTNDGVDIYDGLSGYFDDIVDWEGGKARMEVSLVEAPPLLQIQLQRVQFNRETLQPYKSQAYVRFGETIYLDRFMDNADIRKKTQSRLLQRALNERRERIQVLLEGKNGSFMSTLEHTANFLNFMKEKSVQGVEPGLVGNLRDEQTRVQREIDDIREEIDRIKDQLEDLWKDSKAYPYELTSVFIHRGASPSFGHYFFYSRNFPNEPDSWFKYNDSDVAVVSKDEVLQDTTGSTANPYLLVFARKGSNVVETVNRFDPTQLVTP